MQIPISNVTRVYSGPYGRSRGRAGTYSYASAHVAAEERVRGSKIYPDEVDDSAVKRIVNKMNKLIANGERAYNVSNGVSIPFKNRLYVAYGVKLIDSEDVDV